MGPNPPPTLAAVPPVLGLPLLQQWARTAAPAVPGVASLSELRLLHLLLQWARTAAPAVPGAVSLSELQSSFLSTSDCSSRARNKTPNTRTKIGKLFFDILTIKIIRASVKLGSQLWC